MEAILLLINCCLWITLGAEWTDTSWDQYPFMVLVRNGLNKCGGSIIATHEYNGKGVILTAAHCIVDASNGVVVSIGCTQSDCNNPLLQYDDDFYVVHPLYGSAPDPHDLRNYDVALIFLTKEITNVGARKVGLYPDIDVLTDGADIRVIGYGGGCNDPNNCLGGSDTDTLEYMDTHYLPNAWCEAMYGTTVGGIHDFCIYDTDTDKQSVCGGDSGSPLMYQNMQIGIAQIAHRTCNPDLPQIAMSVPHYYEWIAGQCPECVVNHYLICGANCLINNGGQVIGAKYEVNSKCYIALSGSVDALHDPDKYPAALQQTDCYPRYEYPSCKPDCMINYGGCDDDVPCHEVEGRVYEIEGECWTALSMGCRGCLDSPLSNPSGVRRTACRAFKYPDCSPFCVADSGQCEGGLPCNQVIGRIYQVKGECYKALTDCMGCLFALTMGIHYESTFKLVSCKYRYPECKPDCLIDYGGRAGCPNNRPCHQLMNQVYEIKGVCYLALTWCSGCLNDPDEYPQDLGVVSCVDHPQSAQSFLGHSLSNKLPFEGGDGLSGFQILFVLLFMLVFTVINFVICCCNKQGEYKTIAIKESDDDV